MVNFLDFIHFPVIEHRTRATRLSPSPAAKAGGGFDGVSTRRDIKTQTGRKINLNLWPSSIPRITGRWRKPAKTVNYYYY
jgi:hypothetical protein